MSDDRKSGLALICGSIGGIVAMSAHPTGGSSHLALIAPLAHGIALVSVWLLLLGAIGLTAALDEPHRLAVGALLAFGLASVAVMIATSISGFVMPELLQSMRKDTSGAPEWRILVGSFFQVNQAFSKIYSVATSLSVALWSIAMMRSGAPKGVALYGVVVPPAIAFFILIGHLRLDIHGMTVVMLSQVIWFINAGIWLRRHSEMTDIPVEA